MPRALVWSLYAALVLIGSSTRVVIKIGLEARGRPVAASPRGRRLTVCAIRE